MSRDLSNDRRKAIDILHARLMGRWFGYPTCCIEYFVTNRIGRTRYDHETLTPDEQLVSKFGFIPCADHRRLLLADSLKQEDIIKYRLNPAPFPNQGEPIATMDAAYAVEKRLGELLDAPESRQAS